MPPTAPPISPAPPAFASPLTATNSYVNYNTHTNYNAPSATSTVYTVPAPVKPAVPQPQIYGYAA